MSRSLLSDLHEFLEKLNEQLDERMALREMLVELQWGSNHFCGVCMEDEGIHKPTCRVAMLLERTK